MVFEGALSRRPLTASEPDQELFAIVPALGALRDSHRLGLNTYVGGGPGSGKTTLMRRMEYELCGEAVFVRAEEAGSATELLTAIAAAVGPPGGTPPSLSDTELDVLAVFAALDRWEDRPGRPRVVLADGADREHIRVLFGRYRDSMWDLPLIWMVTCRATAPPPPADSFFDRTSILEPWNCAEIRELIELRIPLWKEDWRDEVASVLAPATPAQAMLALQALVSSREPVRLLGSVADDRTRATMLPHRLRALYEALNLAGPAHAGDPRLVSAMNVSRSRVAHGLNELELMGFVTAERDGRRVRYQTRLHSLLGGVAGREAASAGASGVTVPPAGKPWESDS